MKFCDSCQKLRITQPIHGKRARTDSLAWSSGAVEGNVTKLKAVKRAMYGRANFDLLKCRALLS